MEYQSQYLRSRSDVIYKTNKSDQCQGKHEPGIFEMIRNEISQYAKIKDDPPTPQSDPSMRTAFIGFVDDIAFISNTEIKKFCQEEQN